MAIWFNQALTLEQLLPLGKNTMSEHIGIEWLELGPDFLSARMPVDQRTKQPYGLMHGGASCVLAETLGSVGSAMVVDHDAFRCVGVEINANHIRSARSGWVTGTARPVNLGRLLHVWEIRIEDERGKLVCISRLTVAIVPADKI